MVMIVMMVTMMVMLTVMILMMVMIYFFCCEPLSPSLLCEKKWLKISEKRGGGKAAEGGPKKFLPFFSPISQNNQKISIFKLSQFLNYFGPPPGGGI